MSKLIKNTAGQYLYVSMVNASDGSAITSGTVNGFRTIDGGTQAAVTGTITHKGNGQWELALSQADTNGDEIGFFFTHTSAIPVSLTVFTDSIKVGGLNNLSAADVNAEVDTALADYDAPTKAELDSGFAALNDLSAADVNAEVDTALGDYDGPTKAELDAAFTEIKGATWSAGTDTLEQIRNTVDTKASQASVDTVDGNVDAILLDTGTDIPAQISALNDISEAQVNAQVDAALLDYDGPTKAELDAGFAALNDLSAADVNAEVDAALADIHLDHLLAADYDPASKPGVSTALLNEIVEDDGSGNSRFTRDALDQVAAVGMPGVIYEGTALGGLADTVLTSDPFATSITDEYNGKWIVVFSGASILTGPITSVGSGLIAYDGDGSVPTAGSTYRVFDHSGDLSKSSAAIETSVGAIVSTTVYRFTGVPAINNTLLGAMVVFKNTFGATGSYGERSIRIITAVNGGNDEYTINAAPDFTIQVGFDVKILPFNYLAASNIESILTDTETTIPAQISALNDLSAADVNAEVDTALIDYGGPTSAEMGAAFTEIKGATWDSATDTLEAIRDRGDIAWITGGGGGITQVLSVKPVIPFSVDLADTATVRVGLMLTNAVDDLPTAAEIDPGTISIDRKAQGGTSWSAVVTDAACSELDGLIYFDEVFDSGSGYAEGDSLRITFKSQSITADSNVHEVTGSGGVIFQTFVREAAGGGSGPSAADIRAEIDANSTQLAAIVQDTGTDIPAQISALNDLSAADVNTEVDTALADIHLDHLLAVDYNPASKPGVSTALLNEIVENDGSGNSRFTRDALDQVAAKGMPGYLAEGTVGIGFANLIFSTDPPAAGYDIDYLGKMIVIYASGGPIVGTITTAWGNQIIYDGDTTAGGAGDLYRIFDYSGPYSHTRNGVIRSTLTGIVSVSPYVIEVDGVNVESSQYLVGSLVVYINGENNSNFGKTTVRRIIAADPTNNRFTLNDGPGFNTSIGDIILIYPADPTIGTDVTSVLEDTGATIPAQISALNNLSAAQVNAEVDTALSDYDGPTKTELDAGFAALNDLSAADVNAQVDTALLDYDGPTKAEMDAGFAGISVPSAASIRAEIDANSTQLAAIVQDTGTDIPALIAALNDLSSADVNAELVDVLNVDSFSEPTGVPPAANTIAAKIGYLYMMARNQIEVTNSEKIVYDDGGVAAWKKTLSDDGITYAEGEAETP